MTTILRILLLSGLVLAWLPSCSKSLQPVEEKGSADAKEGRAAPEASAQGYDLDNLPDHPVVVMSTSKGDITIELDNAEAPVSTLNFLRYAQSGHYDGTIFHRVIPDFMIQGGGFTKELYTNVRARPKKTAWPPIKNEADNGLKNLAGTIAMARTKVVDSATCQFFINVKDNPGLDHVPGGRFGYAVFGKVVAGMDVVDAIRDAPTKPSGPHRNLPVDPIEILSVRRAPGR